MADKHPSHRSTCQHYGLVNPRRSSPCLLAANVIDPTGSMNKAQDLSWLRDDPLCEEKIAGFAFAVILIFMQMSNNLQTH